MTDGRVYGRNPVLALLRQGGRRTDEVAVLAGGAGPLTEVVALARRAGVKVSYRTRDQLTAMAGSANHQGVVARVASAEYTDVDSLIAIPPALPVSPTLKVQVTRFTFSGNTLFSDEQLETVVQEFIGKELDFEALTDAATKVRAFHRERGYFLAQAYLPQQAIRDGVVEIAVIEGRVGIVELQRRPATRLAEWLLAGGRGTLSRVRAPPLLG